MLLPVGRRRRLGKKIVEIAIPGGWGRRVDIQLWASPRTLSSRIR
jgi:hypothetical protein